MSSLNINEYAASGQLWILRMPQGKGRWPSISNIMPLCLDSYVLDLHAYSIHEHHQIPYDRPHILDDDVDIHLLLLIP